MKIIQFTLLVLALLSPMAIVQAKSFKAGDTSDEIVGAVDTYLPLVAQSKQNAWVLIKAVSDQFSGCATPSGRANISGSYTVVQQFGTAAAHRSGMYSWSQPNILVRSAIGRQTDPETLRWFESTLFSCQSDGKLPQSATRYLLCILHEKATGQDKFTDVHLVPTAWRGDVLPAVIYLRSHPKINDVNATGFSIGEARSLLRNLNPYLVLTALQLLAANQHLTTADIEAAASSADLNLIACSIAISRLYAWSDQDNYEQWMLARVAAIRSMNSLEGTAVGITATNYIAMSLYSSPVPSLSGTRRLLRPQDIRDWASLPPLVRQKLKELDPIGGASDDRWVNIDSFCRQFGA